MVTKCFLRPNSVTLTTVSPSPLFLFPKPPLSKLTIISLLPAATRAITSNPKALPYGPSLLKGKIPFQHSQQQQQEQYCQSKMGAKLLSGDNQSQDYGKQEDHHVDNIIDKEKFTRVFDIAALRLPAKYCFALESRLRGHLLNWPRIRNVARVPGDEVEEELVPLLVPTQNGNTDEEGNLDALDRRVYGRAEGDGEELSPVLYREKLAKEFNSRGFVKFRNLAKISRPPRKKKKGGEGEEKMREKRKDEIYLVEVVEEDQGEDWKGLLGNEFKGRSKWRGSTRLLLLDESYADKGVEDLPQAVKVANPNTFWYFGSQFHTSYCSSVTLCYSVSYHDSVLSFAFLIQLAVILQCCFIS